MLKLKDIFNIDISSKGGGKLYKKIMRKYNIPLKEIKEVKQEIVECSSNDNNGNGSNGDSKKYWYYKNRNAMYASYNNKLPIIRSIGKTSGMDKRMEILGSMHSYGENAICIPDEEVVKINDANLTATCTIFPKGDLFEKIKVLDIVNIESTMRTAYQEITEEEYYSYLNN